MRHKAKLALALFTVFTASCGESDPCIKTNVVCLERETPDNLVMEGTWEGTYHVDRHWLGTNDVRLVWHDGAYRLRVEREGVEREPFYKTTSFTGYGDLAQGQRDFRAAYAVEEVWHFIGRYVLDGPRIVFKGWIETHGKTIGDFRMERSRKCAIEAEQRENVCVDQASAEDIAPRIVAAAVTPNPVSAATALSLSATADPAAEWRWQVTIVPVTAPSNVYASFATQATRFAWTTTAPAAPGEYAVRFRVEGNGHEDEKEEALTVR